MSTFEGRARSAWATQPPEAALEREGAIHQRMSELARGLAAAKREIAADKREIKRLLADLAAAKATSGGKDTNVSDAVAAAAVEKLKRIQEQKRSRRRRRRERLKATTGAAAEPARGGTGAANAADEDRDTPMEFADSEEPGCDEEAERAAVPLVELDQAAADSNCGKSAVTGAGEVGTLVPAVPTAEVEPEVMEEDDEDGDDDFKVGDVVVYCGVRNEWADDDFVEPGDVGSVIGPSYDDDEDWWVPVKFPHSEIDCRGGCLRLYTEGKQKAIEDGLQPKRLYSDIDHTGESPGPPESKKAQQARQDHGQADGGHEAKSQDYGTRFVNGNKGVG
jgi:hypothetical protein